MAIFHAYDVRGIVDKELSEDIYYVLGAAFVELMKSRSDIHIPIVVGRDGRTTSERYAQSFIDALVDRGVSVIDLGICTTPAVYFAVRHLHAGGGAMITASHNPAQYNGLKIVNAFAQNLSPLEEAQLLTDFATKHTIEDIPVGQAAHPKHGKAKTLPKYHELVTAHDILPHYIKYLLQFASDITNLRVAADAGNGVGGVDFIPLAENLNIEVFPLFMDIDGQFPNHEANPSKVDTLATLQKYTVQNNCDFGIAFDGDADRIGFVDEKGNIVPADIIGCLLAHESFKKSPNMPIIHDLLCTDALDELASTIEGAKSIRTKVGRHNIAKAMAQNNAAFGVELSGHFFHSEFFGLDNAILTFIKVASIVSIKEQPLSQLVGPFLTYYKESIVNIEVTDRNASLAALEKAFPKTEIDRLDGVSLRAENWHFTARQSNTEPLLRLSLEAKDKATYYATMKKINAALEPYVKK